MAKKKSTPPPEDSEQKAIEEKIDKMLDPHEPDTPKVEVLKKEAQDEAVEVKLPTKIEIKDHSSELAVAEPDEPRGAPEVSSTESAIKDEAEESEEAAELAEEDIAEEADIIGEEDGAMEEKVDQEAGTPADQTEEDTTEETDDKTDAAVDEPDDKDDTSDTSLDEAVDDIAKEESDKLLENADDSAQKAATAPKKSPLKTRIADFFKAWWANKMARYSTLAVLLLGIVIAALLPVSRYYVLNMVGVRSSASIKIIDASTLQPLKNVTVEVHGVSTKTSKDGVATLEHLKLGKTNLKIHKRAFSSIDRSLTIGWGSNPLADEQLTPTGTQYEFVVTDFVSGEPLQGVEVVSGEASALSNENGEIKLTMDMPSDQFEAQIIGEGLRTETLTINADEEKVYEVQLVPAKKHVFMSRRNGTFDVYAVYVDGKDEQLLLKGTGEERKDITLVSHPSRSITALVSTRSGKRNSDGYQLSTLTIIDESNVDEPKTIISSERIQIIGWKDERLIFVQIKSGTSAANPDRHQLKTYNIDQDVTAELASANYFNDVMLANGLLLFAPSSAYAKTPAGLYRMNPDGSDKQVVHAEEVWSMFRSSYNVVTFTTGKDWFSFSISDRQTEQLNGEPTEYTSRVYVTSPDNTKSLWVDQVDGKGSLFVYVHESNEETTVVERGGLQLPVAWLNNETIVFRVKTAVETADYVVSTRGGEAKKLTDVTNAAGLDRWYYY